jgi:hypothetical protein
MSSSCPRRASGTGCRLVTPEGMQGGRKMTTYLRRQGHLVAAVTTINHSDTGRAVHVDRVSQKLVLEGIAASVGSIGDAYDEGFASYRTSRRGLGENSFGRGVTGRGIPGRPTASRSPPERTFGTVPWRPGASHAAGTPRRRNTPWSARTNACTQTAHRHEQNSMRRARTHGIPPIRSLHRCR